MANHASNEEIACIFEKMSRVLALKGKDRFRVLAYQKAAQSIRDLEQDLSSRAEKGKLEEIPGIGKDLAGKIAEALETGHIRQCERECRNVPDSLLTLFEVRGLGPKTIALLHRSYKVCDVDDLRRLLASGKLSRRAGFGEKKITAMAEALESWTASHKRMLLGLALPQAEGLLEEIRNIKLVGRAALAGSLRRGRETIGDVDLLVTSEDSAQALKEIGRLPQVTRVIAMGPTRATLLLGNLQVDIRAVAPESFGAALQYFTGSKQHNTHLRAIARQRGLKVNEYGVFRGEKSLGGADEEKVYGLLKMPWIAPELREDRGEIEAAQRGSLPDLVELKHVRGDLHAHTTYSDGRSTVAEMVERAATLGYEYISLTDHSPSQHIAHGLDLRRLESKIKEVRSVCKARTTPRVLLGAEVDILPDGSLDYPDDVLAKFDVVIAAVHGNFNQSRGQMTARILKAIAHPCVNILAHPTARLIDRRPAIEFDFSRVVAAAKEAGVALEIDGSPWRLDLNDILARSAHEAGALLAITADAHSTAQLSFMRFGVMQARRGWTPAASLVNTWPWHKLEAWLTVRRPRAMAWKAAS
ncbi:MAG TPA: DNA polymerase/3'-5' exonuclease PolX [Candidatus Limnocylindrales bacterium]|nr:DNA polymerase/3'-5' exonuclease PolX [Candidatus Limnocylindrales bacterium]